MRVHRIASAGGVFVLAAVCVSACTTTTSSFWSDPQQQSDKVPTVSSSDLAEDSTRRLYSSAEFDVYIGRNLSGDVCVVVSEDAGLSSACAAEPAFNAHGLSLSTPAHRVAVLPDALMAPSEAGLTEVAPQVWAG